MNAHTATLAENLTPPFVAAIFSDTAIVRHLDATDRRPSDEMVSLAPKQDGFLGLETIRDETGRWISISYWRDMPAYTAWRHACIERVKIAFPDAPLESLCQIRVATVEHPVPTKTRKHITANAPVPTSAQPKPRNRLFDAIPSIAEFFNHAHAR